MHKRFSARKLVLVVFMFLVFIMNSYALDENDFSMGLDVDNSNPNVSDRITVSVDIENLNETTSAEDFQLTSSYSESVLNYSDSSPSPYQIDDGSLVWNFTIENSSSLLIDVSFDVIGNESTAVSFTLRNTSGESLISEILDIDVRSNITTQTENQSNESNTTQEEAPLYSLLDLKVDVELQNRSMARYVKGVLIVNTSDVNVSYSAENSSNYSLIFKDVNITENSTAFLSAFSYNKSDFSGGAVQFYEDDEKYSEFDFKDIFPKNNHSFEIRLKEYDEDEVGIFLSDALVTYVAPTYADFLGIDKEIIEKIREVKIEKKSYTNPQITDNNIKTIKSQDSELGDVLSDQNASHQRRNSKMNVTYEVYEVFTENGQRYFITEIEKELVISTKLEDSYYRIIDYIPKNVTESASEIFGKNFEVLYDDPIIYHEINFTGINNETAKIRFSYMLQTNIHEEEETILTGVFAREEYKPIFQSAPTGDNGAEEQETQVQQNQEEDDNEQEEQTSTQSTENTQLSEGSDDSNGEDPEIEVIEAAEIDESYYRSTGKDDDEPGILGAFFGLLTGWQWFWTIVVLYLVGDTIFFLRLKENRDRLKRAMRSDYKRNEYE